MSRSFTYTACATVLFLTIAPVVVLSETVEPSGEASLAWRLDSMSTALLVGSDRPPAAFKLSAALLYGAEKLLPDESRFPRLQVLAYKQAGDTDEAIAALIRYRKLKPADPVAQVDLVDLYASQQETLDGKLNYLSETAQNQKVNLLPEVRATLATEATMLLAQKSPELAADMATKAVKFYPLPKATELYYFYVASKQSLPQRIAGLMAILKANPAQIKYLSELASLLAENGLAEDSLRWYELVESIVRDSRIPPPPGFHNLRVDYAAEWVIAGKIQRADVEVGNMLTEQPLDADARFLELTIAQSRSEESYKSALDLARTAFVRRWNQMHSEILTGRPSTKPAALPPPADEEHTPDKIQPLDPTPVKEKVLTPGNEAMKAAVISVASDIAWFELYFDHDAQAADKWINILRPLVAADSPTLQNLLGWQKLASKQPADARDILQRIASQDPLASLGVIVADQMEKKPIDPGRIPALLDQNRMGVVGAMLWSAFKSDADRPKPRPDAAAVRDEINKFPPALFLVLNPSQAAQVYALQGEPLQTIYDYGTPVLAQVSIENRSDVDLTFGADALIHRDLWFDAETIGNAPEPFPGVAFDKLQGTIVLQPHHAVSQIVRLDEGKLRQLLHNSPGTDTTTVNCYVMTNPIPLTNVVTGQEIGIPAPGGSEAHFIRTFSYAGLPLSMPGGPQKLQAWMSSTSAVQKIHAVDLIAAYIRLARKPNANPALVKLTADLPKELAKLRADPIPLVSGWASYVASGLALTPEEAQQIAADMSLSPQWSTRLLSVLAGGARPAAMRRQVASRLANDPNDAVKSAASAMMEWIEQTPAQITDTTQPATLPAAR